MNKSCIGSKFANQIRSLYSLLILFGSSTLFLSKNDLHFFSDAFTLKMGLLKVGVPQPWPKSKKNLRYIRKAGVRQFISHYNRVKDLKGDELLWGDEIEYGIFYLDKEKKEIRLSLRAKEVSSQRSL